MRRFSSLFLLSVCLSIDAAPGRGRTNTASAWRIDEPDALEWMLGQWDDKFERAERKWSHWTMQDYAQPDRVLPALLEDKARRHGNRTVFQFRNSSVTFEELNESINRYANGFLALGIKPGDNVAVMLPNCAEFLYIWFGLNKIGAANVPINVAQRGDGLAYQIARADSVVLVVEESYLAHVENVLGQLPSLRHILVRNHSASSSGDYPGVAVARLDDLAAFHASAPDVATSFKSLSSILYTSGTTGRSKGVMISHNYWYEMWAEAVKYGRYTEDDVLYTGLPFFHSSATGTTVGPAILADAKAVLVERFSASRMMQDTRDFGVTAAKYIGSIIPIMMKQPETPLDADNPVRIMVGSAAPAHLWEPFQQRFNTQLLEGYGMTECTICLVNPYENRRPGSCGKPLTGWNVKIVDDDDNEVPAGTVGEFVAQPTRPHLGTMGYFNDPEATLELMRNFWIHTGDLGKVGDDGYFYYVDRKKHALRRRGENVSSFEVEAVIDSHPDVQESCVVGVPSDMGEEEVKAVIVLREGATLSPEDIVRWSEPRIAYFAIPRYIAFRDSLPKTPSQRVEKYRLKQEGVTPDCWDREAAGIVLAR